MQLIEHLCPTFKGGLHAINAIRCPKFKEWPISNSQASQGKISKKELLQTLCYMCHVASDSALPYLCPHMCAIICVLSYVCSHMCVRICLLSYVCFHMCALLCLLSCAFICMPLSALICVSSTSSSSSSSSPPPLVSYPLAPRHCLVSLAGIICFSKNGKL